jgi:hypothetical protein
MPHPGGANNHGCATLLPGVNHCAVVDTRGLPVPTPYINAVELDIVPADYEKFQIAMFLH